MFRTKDYSHLAGVQIPAAINMSNGRVSHIVLEAAFVEYDMGITLVATKGMPGKTCINGKSSPNKSAYRAFAKEYDRDFKYIVDCLENQKPIQIPFPGDGDSYDDGSHGRVSCASGMPV